MEIRETGECAYFAASNSKKGFFSYYDACFDRKEIKRVYAVKGGPGTGKSRFLREVAKAGEAKGYDVEYIYCSSDPNSLDGVILKQADGGVALLDATAPHAYEPKHPGVREEIVNLGDFWDSKKLESVRDRIESESEKKSRGYRRAYRYLSGFGELESEREDLVATYVKKGAVECAAKRLLSGLPVGTGYSVRPALQNSFGMEGAVGLDSFFACAEKRILVEDCWGTAGLFLSAVGRLAVERKQPILLSQNPLIPEKPDGIFFEKEKISVTVANPKQMHPPFSCVHMRRFVEVSRMREVKKTLNQIEQTKRMLLSGAEVALQEVKKSHFALESLYQSAMDFSAKERFTRRFVQTLFS